MTYTLKVSNLKIKTTMGSQNKQRVGRFGKTVQLTKTITQMSVGEIFYIYKKSFIKTDKGIFLSVNTKIIPTKAIDRLFPDLEDLIIECVPIKRTNIGIAQDDFYVDFTDIGYSQYLTSKKKNYLSLIKNLNYILFDIKLSQDDHDFMDILYNDTDGSVVLVADATCSILRSLQTDLEYAIAEEDYLQAAHIFEEIKKLKDQKIPK